MDRELFIWLNHALSGPWCTPFFSIVTHLGNGLVLAVLILPILFWCRRDDFRTHALPLILAVAISGGIVNIIKPIVDRERPGMYFSDSETTINIPLGTPPDKAFPSGHTQTAFGTAVYLALLYPKLSPLFILAASLVGLSRIAIGVHYPLDVIVGALFGISISWVTFMKVRRRKNRQQ